MTAAITKHGTLHHVSVSQIRTFAACPRKWGWDKIDKIELKASGRQNFGIVVHKLLQTYGLTKIPPAGDEPPAIAARALIAAVLDPLLGQLSTPAWFEQELSGMTIAGVPVEGYIDVLGKMPGGPVVLDYKTVGTFRYCKTKSELSEDLQMVVYARYALDNLPGTSCEVEHAYATQPPKDWKPGDAYKPRVREVSARIHAEDLPELWAPIEVTVERMKLAASAKTAKELEPNAGECNAFGGCPYRHLCEISPADRMLADMDSVPLAAIIPPDAPSPTPVQLWSPTNASDSPRA